ncbi:MAG: GTP cyclohydrolase I [Polyangiaceae bacterium]
MADRERAARAIEDFLRALGCPIEGELVGTGKRVADAWADEFLSGAGVEPAALLAAGSLDLGEGPHGPVVLRAIAISTMCPHHLLPSQGTATIGYQPTRLAAGLGTIAQAVDACARRLTLQETLGQEIADALVAGLGAAGSFCRLELRHTCFSNRGERQANAIIDTVAFGGAWASSPARESALALAVSRA